MKSMTKSFRTTSHNFQSCESKSCSVMSDSLRPPWTVEFSRPEYWSGLPFPSPDIFPTEDLNAGLPHCRWILYQLSHKGILEWVAYPISRESSPPRNWTRPWIESVVSRHLNFFLFILSPGVNVNFSRVYTSAANCWVKEHSYFN